MTTQKDQSRKKSTRDLKNLGILLENSAEGLGCRREHCWGYVFIYENTPKRNAATLLECSRKGAVGA